MNELYNRDYFERGIESGVSCYQNYRWIPELTIPMAMTMIDYLEVKPNQTILDFGCAKGYLVKALRWLNRKAWGIDISKYALHNCDPEISGVCWSPLDYKYFGPDYVDFVIAKDVFEHIGLTDLSEIVKEMIHNGGKVCSIFAVIPLGENGVYRAPANNLDATHVNCMNEDEWRAFFERNGLRSEKFTFKIKGIKDSYYDRFPKSHGFFTLCS